MFESMRGKVAIVTGGTAGLGRSTALAFAQQGVKVVIAGRSADKGAAVVREIQERGGEASFVQTDVSRAADVERMVDHTLATYDRLDYAFNNAGVITLGLIPETSEDDWDLVINTGLKGIWLCLKYEIPAMAQSGGGAIVNMASTSGVTGHATISAYSASKGGIIALTRVAAIEGAKAGIRVNAVSPSMIETDMSLSIPNGLEILTAVGLTYPIGRHGQPEEVANPVVFLCSDGASFITGHNLLIDGGETIM
ncbi:MAG TPA: glucose 1-dehydrogenase [Herpetosiphonaceae bacterium]